MGWLLVSFLAANAQISEMETEYLRLAERFELRDQLVQRDLRTYLKQYPYTTYESDVHFMLGVMQVERGYYKQALKDLELTDYSALGRQHRSQYQFYRGYAYLMQQNYERAALYFHDLKKGKSSYATRGAYYYAYCQYKLGDYNKALPELLQLEDNAEYSATVPYYIVQIYYAQKQYDQVMDRINTLLKEQPESENNGELHRILGEMQYQQGNYSEAIAELQAYQDDFTKQKKEIVRNDIYLLGMAQYKTAQYEAAIQTLRKVKQGNDSISESTMLTLGNAYIQTNQIEQAKLNFQAVMNMSKNAQVREEAAYNYALTTYRSSSALGESVTAFTEFLKNYPNSKHQKEIYQLLSDAFMQSKNYSAALEALDSISTNDASIAPTKQYLRYQLGTDAFVQGKMQDAKKWMTTVIDNRIENDQFVADAYYWRAESEYRLREYEACKSDIDKFYNLSTARRSPNFNNVAYLQGYTFFSLHDYKAANKAFAKYIDTNTSSGTMYADALNRMGDCSFNAREFESAIGYYSQVIAQNGTGSDYATFQKGYALGLLRRYDDKIKTLQQLVSRYPRSDYADDGLYEIARAQLQLEQQKEAVESYERLLKTYPNSNMARKAAVERGMIYRSLQEYDKAIEAYKQTITKYPATEEAYIALDGLEAIYVETNNINEYLKYTKQLGKLNMSVSTKEDSLSYAAAELQYMQGNYKQAIASFGSYISKYCAGGRYCTTAQYYIADSYYRLEDYNSALAEYKTLSNIAGNPYMEEANTRVAELSYDKKDYNTALEYFYKMLSAASSREQTDVARIGILRCSYYLNQTQTTIDIAKQILEDEPVATEIKEEALYNRSKAYVATKQYGLAIVDLTPLAQDVRTAIGAEAKYLLAECYYQLHATDNAEQEIMSFTQMNTQQQYWLAKALILLSDINVDRGDDFQAQQYLLTLQNNYRQNDDIQTIVSERLSAITERQKEKVED